MRRGKCLIIVDRGYHVTLLKDCTAGFTVEQSQVATDIVWPLFANKVTTVDEWTNGFDVQVQ